MSKEFYIYTDDKNIIIDIKLEMDLVLIESFNLIKIDENKSFLYKDDIEKYLYLKNARTFIFSETKKIIDVVFIYYNRQSYTIECITPIKILEHDTNEQLFYGISVITNLLKEIMNGEENINNFRVRDIGNGYLEFNKIKTNIIKVFNDSIEIIENYKIKKENEYPHIVLVYNKNNNSIRLKPLIEIDTDQMSIIPIHIVDATDKSILYETVVYDFSKKQHNDIKYINAVDRNIDFYLIHDYRLIVEIEE